MLIYCMSPIWLGGSIKAMFVCAAREITSSTIIFCIGGSGGVMQTFQLAFSRFFYFVNITNKTNPQTSNIVGSIGRGCSRWGWSGVLLITISLFTKIAATFEAVRGRQSSVILVH